MYWQNILNWILLSSDSDYFDSIQPILNTTDFFFFRFTRCLTWNEFDQLSPISQVTNGLWQIFPV